MNRSLSYAVFLVGTFCWCAAIFVPPFVAPAGPSGEAVSNGAYQFFSHVCHQFESRSVHIGGQKVAVCARCMAIYLGFFVGVACFPLIRIKDPRSSAMWLFLAALPMLSDVFFDIAHLHSSDFVTRLVTGTVFGIGAAFLLTPVFIDACTELTSGRTPNRGETNELKA